MRSDIKAVILAAGKGTRLHSEQHNLPKVLRLAAGKTLLSYVLEALDFIPKHDIVIVAGYKKQLVFDAFPEYSFASQDEQLGTGHAAQCAFEEINDFDGALLICCGDMPLMKKATYQALISTHFNENNLCTILSGVSEAQLPYGRIVRNADGGFVKIVEDKDCSPEEKEIRELNAGVYVFNAKALKTALASVDCKNAQGEYYLTDAPENILRSGGKVGICMSCTPTEMLGVNTPDQLAEAEETLQKLR